MFYLPGPAHAQKNWARQMRAFSRGLFFGRLPIDIAALAELGVPPAAFQGTDPQSDKECCLLLSPHFCVQNVESAQACQDKTESALQVSSCLLPQVPWSLYGFLAMNTTAAMSIASLLHADMSSADRCFNAVAGYALLDLANLFRCEAAELSGQTPDSSFLHPVTLRNLQQVAGASVLLTLGAPEGLRLKRSRLSELKIEQWFSLLRRQFSNAAKNVRDYIQASARQQRRHLQEVRRGGDALTEGGKPLQRLPEQDFALISRQAGVLLGILRRVLPGA